MHLEYQKTGTQGPKPKVTVLWCAECTPEPFRARSERECMLWLVRETAAFVLVPRHYLKTPTIYVCTNSGEPRECIYGIYFEF